MIQGWGRPSGESPPDAGCSGGGEASGGVPATYQVRGSNLIFIVC